MPAPLGTTRLVPDRLVAGILSFATALALVPVLHAQAQKRVLVVYSTRRDAELSLSGDRDFPRIVAAELKSDIDYYSEYLDLPRFPDPTYESRFREALAIKYGAQQLDAVVGVQDQAYRVLTRFRDDVFASVPLVFLAQSPVLRRPLNSAGVISEPDFAGTIALATVLQPEVRRVFLVSGCTSEDKENEARARQQLRRFESQIEFAYLVCLRTAELERQVAHLPKDSIIYYLSVLQDGEGQNFNPLTYLDRITAVANRPTYSWTESTLNRGIVGGKLRSQRLQIDAVAKLTARILRGDAADAIPLAASSMNGNQVDWRQVQRWHIDQARLPADTQILFRNPSAWQKYKAYISIAVALIFLQTALIASLLVQRSRRRRAELLAKKVQTELGAKYDEIRHLGSRLIAAQEIERFRLARELHDDVTQRLGLLACELNSLLDSAVEPEEIRRLVLDAQNLGNSLRNISHGLHPTELQRGGLVLSLTALKRQYLNVGVRVDVVDKDLPEGLSSDIALSIFRVVQEAVHNAIKHGSAKRIFVKITGIEERLKLTISDDGTGFDPKHAVTGLGLLSMRERISSLNGTLDVTSTPGLGTTLEVTVPLT